MSLIALWELHAFWGPASLPFCSYAVGTGRPDRGAHGKVAGDEFPALRGLP